MKCHNSETKKWNVTKIKMEQPSIIMIIYQSCVTITHSLFELMSDNWKHPSLLCIKCQNSQTKNCKLTKINRELALLAWTIHQSLVTLVHSCQSSPIWEGGGEAPSFYTNLPHNNVSLKGDPSFTNFSHKTSLITQNIHKFCF